MIRKYLTRKTWEEVEYYRNLGLAKRYGDNPYLMRKDDFWDLTFRIGHS